MYTNGLGYHNCVHGDYSLTAINSNLQDLHTLLISDGGIVDISGNQH